MTNDSTRQTLKTGFINNDDMYMYTGALGSDYVKLTANATVVNTNILYSLISGIANTTPLYIVLKFDSYEISLVNQIVSIPPNPATDYANILSNQSTKIVITLPVINGTQKTIPRDGSWVVTIYTDRQAQKQALSKALKYKPQADL
jgi:hypothetical protein